MTERNINYRVYSMVPLKVKSIRAERLNWFSMQHQSLVMITICVQGIVLTGITHMHCRSIDCSKGIYLSRHIETTIHESMQHNRIFTSLADLGGARDALGQFFFIFM